MTSPPLSRRWPPQHACTHCNHDLSTSLTSTSTTACPHAHTATHATHLSATPTSPPLTFMLTATTACMQPQPQPLHLSCVHIDGHHNMYAPMHSDPCCLFACVHHLSTSHVDVHHSMHTRSAATVTDNNGHCPSTTSLRSTTVACTHGDGEYHHPHHSSES